jgi:hypothetical protein
MTMGKLTIHDNSAQSDVTLCQTHFEQSDHFVSFAERILETKKKLVPFSVAKRETDFRE